MRLEGRSRSRGKVPKWLQQAANFGVLGFEPGSTIVALEASSIQEALPQRFAQGHLFREFDPNRSSLDLFEESLGDALNGRGESDLYDQSLLGVILGFGRVLGSGIEQIEFGQSPNLDRLVKLDPERLRSVEQLKRQTPANQRVRIAGRLDTIRHSDGMFTLLLDDGQSIRGLAEKVEPHELAKLFGRRAMVSGTAIFRPSGSVLRIEIDRLEAAGTDSAIWSQMPRPAFGRTEAQPLLKKQGPRSGVNKIFGQWPGQESDEEIQQALEALS